VRPISFHFSKFSELSIAGKMSRQVVPVGSMICLYDWVVPDLNLAKSQFLGPIFQIQEERFFFGYSSKSRKKEVWVWLLHESRTPITLARFSIHLIRNADGSEKELCQKTNFTINCNNFPDLTPDAKLLKADRSSNGVLWLRCRIEIGPPEIKLSKVPPIIKDQKIADDIRREFEELAFTDLVLVSFIFNNLRFNQDSYFISNHPKQKNHKDIFVFCGNKSLSIKNSWHC
jgi:hypothetical protein